MTCLRASVLFGSVFLAACGQVSATEPVDAAVPEVAAPDVAEAAIDTAEIDAWSFGPTSGAPSPRRHAAVVWTGSELIVFGGVSDDGASTYLADGARYDGATRTWRPISLASAPTARARMGVAWTGADIIVWGGACGAGCVRGDGARYRPSTDTWTPIASASAPSARHTPAMVAASGRAVVWGGSDATDAVLGDGAAYDPETDTWKTVSSEGAPTPRTEAAARNAGSLMLIFGGRSGATRLANGGSYDPKTDLWLSIPAMPGGPRVEFAHAAAFGRLQIYGGTAPTGGKPSNRVDEWDPLSTTWRSIDGAPALGAPIGGSGWIGSEAIFFGNLDGAAAGVQLDYEKGIWTAYPSSPGTVIERSCGAAIGVSTTEVIVWGTADASGRCKNAVLHWKLRR